MEKRAQVPLALIPRLLLAGLMILLFCLGVFPGGLLRLIRAAVERLV